MNMKSYVCEKLRSEISGIKKHLGVECLGQNVQNVCQLLEIIVPESGCMSLYSPQQIPVGPQSWQTLFCFILTIAVLVGV